MHYRDGREAKIGDLVVGTTYNRLNADGSKRVMVGVLLDITSKTSDVCNCVVGFASMSEIPALPGGDTGDKYIDGRPVLKTWYDVLPGHKGFYSGWVDAEGSGREAKTYTLVLGDFDYSECKALDLVYRPGEPRE